MPDRVEIELPPPRGMIQLRVDLSDHGVRAAITEVIGLDVPVQRKRTAGPDMSLVWMSPDELLVVCDHDSAEGTVARLKGALGSFHHLCANVSDARAIFTLTGPRWRDVLAKGMPIDFRDSAFGPGEVRRSRLGQVAAAIWIAGDNTAELVCFRSVAGFVEEWLKTASLEGSLPEFF